jgi:formylglycine-generating enzyme required for sulfatase activity
MDPNCPVENISWLDAVEFCKKLSDLPEERVAGRVYRLPTEAEWEYSCRAGSTTAFFCDSFDLEDYAWFSSSSTHPVVGKKPNPWGLYDMHGNVWEWCSDWYGDYPTSSVIDPVGPASGSLRSVRGGSWRNRPETCRSAYRYRLAPETRNRDLGFRVALSPSAIPTQSEID